MLTADQIGFFREEGYLVVEDAIGPRLLAGLRAEYGALLDSLYDGWAAQGLVPQGGDFWQKLGTAYAAGCDWFQPMDCSLPGGPIAPDTPMHFGPALFDTITSPHLLDIVESLIGPEITSCPIQHIRIKPPQGDVRADEARAHITTTDWHQDRGVALAEADATDMVTVWLAITDVTEASAPLEVIPRAHRDGLIAHCAGRQTGIPATLLPERRGVPLPCPAGSAILFHPLTPHASRPNLSQGFRWSFDLRYTRTGQPTGRAQFPSFIARSRADPAAELHDAGEWLWTAARARLAGVPEKPIHRWDSTAPHCA